MATAKAKCTWEACDTVEFSKELKKVTYVGSCGRTFQRTRLKCPACGTLGHITEIDGKPIEELLREESQ